MFDKVLMQKWDLNPISLGRFDLCNSPDRLTLDEAKVIQNQVDFTENIKSHQYNNARISKSSSIIEDLNLPRLGLVLDTYSSLYCNQHLGILNKFKRIHSWATCNEKGSRHELHLHPNSMISLVYYFNENFEDDEFSNIVFTLPGLNNIFPDFKFVLDYEPNFYSYNSFSISPKNHCILAFPSFLLHHSNLNTSPIKRYVIGANYFVNDKLGTITNITNLDIKT